MEKRIIPSNMPDEIGLIYEQLYHDVCELHLEWLFFCQLFHRKDVVELLNATAPGFFGLIQNMLWNSTLLGICRLTDKKRVAGKDTLSLEQLIESLKGSHDLLKSKLETCLISARDSASAARERRNHRIAHSNLDIKLADVDYVELVTFNNTKEAMSQIRLFMNTVESHFDSAPVAYEWTLPIEDATRLISCLRKACQPNHSKFLRE